MLVHLATIADSIFNPTDAHLEDLVLHIGQCINWVVGFGWEFRFLLDPGILNVSHALTEIIESY